MVHGFRNQEEAQAFVVWLVLLDMHAQVAIAKHSISRTFEKGHTLTSCYRTGGPRLSLHFL